MFENGSRPSATAAQADAPAHAGEGRPSAGEGAEGTSGVPPQRADRASDRSYLAQIRPGERIDAILLVSNIQLGTKRDGEPFLSMLLGDRTATIPGRWWGVGEAMAQTLPDPGILRVKGQMKDFNGTPQMHIDVISAVDPAAVDLSQLLPTTKKDVEEMFSEVAGMLLGMKSATLRRLAEAYLSDSELMERFKRAPAAMNFHHAYLGGLLEHTHNTMHVARAVCAFYPTLNAELVLLGIFVHDLAKTWELEYATGFDYSDAGRLVGHVVKSAMWVEEKARAAHLATGEPIPRQVIDTLQHIILSHHGDLSLGFGSAKSPATPEAWAVHMIENLDAKLTMALAACREPSNATSRWTPYHKALQNVLFRPDVVRDADGGE